MNGAIKRSILEWYAAHRPLPWRETRDPYAIWVSETMLQQTRAATVVPYWERFLRELPTVQSLAEAPEERVLELWSGLGYYRRARMLREAARRVMSLHGGQLPRDTEALLRLEGVGAYTAGAIASIAFKERVAAVDGNVSRVLARIFAVEDDVTSAPGKARIQAAADALAAIDDGDAGDWSQALMELGALVCIPRRPRCRECPARARCLAHARGIEQELPRKPPKREPKVVHRVAIVLARGRCVLLARRRSDAPFGGLWEPPIAPRAAKKRLAARLGIELADLREVGEVVHVLSHRRMHVQVLRGTCKAHKTFPLPGPDYVAIELVPFSALTDLRLPHPRSAPGADDGNENENANASSASPGASVGARKAAPRGSAAHGALTRKVLDMAKAAF
jgi:A/G-specific adenine glycosylase